MADVSLQNQIRMLRFQKKMTQEELALRVGVSRQTIMSIENGNTNPSILLAFKVAMALGVTLEDAFSVTGRLVPI